MYQKNYWNMYLKCVSHFLLQRVILWGNLISRRLIFGKTGRKLVGHRFRFVRSSSSTTEVKLSLVKKMSVSRWGSRDPVRGGALAPPPTGSPSSKLSCRHCNPDPEPMLRHLLAPASWTLNSSRPTIGRAGEATPASLGLKS